MKGRETFIIYLAFAAVLSLVAVSDHMRWESRPCSAAEDPISLRRAMLPIAKEVSLVEADPQ